MKMSVSCMGYTGRDYRTKLMVQIEAVNTLLTVRLILTTVLEKHIHPRAYILCHVFTMHSMRNTEDDNEYA